MQYKISEDARVPVRLYDEVTGEPVDLVVFGDVTVTILKSDGDTATWTPSVSEWVEEVTGSFVGTGFYSLIIPDTQNDTVGPLSYAVAVAGCVTFVNDIQIVEFLDSDLSVLIEGVQNTVDAGATAAALDAVNTNVAMLDARVQIQNEVMETLWDYQTGKWQIFSTGPDANRIVFYKEDGVTVVGKFDLADISGNPTYRTAFSRSPV